MKDNQSDGLIMSDAGCVCGGGMKPGLRKSNEGEFSTNFQGHKHFDEIYEVFELLFTKLLGNDFRV